MGTNISPYQGIFEDDFPFPKVGYVSSLEGTCEQCLANLRKHDSTQPFFELIVDITYDLHKKLDFFGRGPKVHQNMT